MNIKHSKYKNTGILFELLVRQVTADTLNGVESAAIKLIQKYFVKSELGKEYKLYEALTKSTSLTESKANVLIQALLESSKKLNRGSLKREKYNLINEIKEAKVEAEVLQEFQSYDKDTRMLTYRILMEKFNGKYDGLHNSQKEVLRQYVNSVDSTPVLKEFYNAEVEKIKIQLAELNSKVDDKAVQIKINEVVNLIEELDKTSKVTSDNIVNILQYLELVEELKSAHG